MSTPHGEPGTHGKRTRRTAGRITLAGELEIFGLGTVMTILEMERASGVVEVRGARAQAWLWWRDGALLRASVRGGAVLVGRDAIFAALALTEGSFVFRSGPVACPDEIKSNVPQILMLAAQRADELAA